MFEAGLIIGAGLLCAFGFGMLLGARWGIRRAASVESKLLEWMVDKDPETIADYLTLKARAMFAHAERLGVQPRGKSEIRRLVYRLETRSRGKEKKAQNS